MIAPIRAPSPGNEPSNCQAGVPGCSALNTDLAMSPTMISMSRPPMNPRTAHQVAVVHVRGQRVLVWREVDRQLNRLAAGQQHGILPAQLRIWRACSGGNGLEGHPVYMEVVRLIMRVAYRPQLCGAGSNNSVDARHLHLVTVDFTAVELDCAPGCHMIKRDRGTGFQPFRNPATLRE